MFSLAPAMSLLSLCMSAKSIQALPCVALIADRLQSFNLVLEKRNAASWTPLIAWHYCAGGRGGPTFQALPEPAPLPPLPRPAQPEATMGPTSAPAGEGQPAATTLQVCCL